MIVFLLFVSILLTSCGPSKIVIELSKKPPVLLEKKDSILILPFGYINLSTSKDFYDDGSLDFSNELYKRLTRDESLNVVEITKADEIFRKYAEAEEITAEILKEISEEHGISYIILGDIEFDTTDASSYDRKRVYDPRYGRYITYSQWVRRRKFKINLHYKVYSSKEEKYIKDESKSDDLIVEEEYQQQVYGFWNLMPSLIEDIVNIFVSKKVEAKKFILK